MVKQCDNMFVCMCVYKYTIHTIHTNNYLSHVNVEIVIKRICAMKKREEDGSRVRGLLSNSYN